MVELARRFTAVAARRFLLAIGGIYAAQAASYAFVVDSRVGVDVVVVSISGGAGLLVLAVGYRLVRSDVRPELYFVVTTWCLGGIGVLLAILGLVEVAAGLRNAYQNVLILTGLGAVAGVAAGSYDARARTRELELAETVEQLQTANQRLEQFTYATSHDLQEPLRMISSYLQLLESRHREELDDDAREYLDFAVDGADRMRAMIDSLFEYSRVTPADSSLEPTDSDTAVESVLDDLQPRIEESNATISVGNLPTVLADPSQLEQLFEHLLSNALSFSGEAPPRVHVGAEKVDESWRFSVADEGVGIDPEYHNRLFEVFEKLHGGDTPASDAAGFGLPLCERIVERHGGDIWVESDGEDGATFYFTIPATGTEQSVQPVESTAAE